MDRRRPLMPSRPSMQPTALMWGQTPAGNILWHRPNADERKHTILGFGAGWTLTYGLVLITLFTAAAVLIGLGVSGTFSSSNTNEADLASIPPPGGSTPPPPPPGGSNGNNNGNGDDGDGSGTSAAGVLTDSSGSGIGDPVRCFNIALALPSTSPQHFVGFDGTPFDFHGHSGGFFNLLSEDLLQINSQFDDQHQGAGWTFMQSIGIKYRPSNTRIAVELASAGKMQVTVNKRVLQPIYGTVRMQLGPNAWLRYTTRADSHTVDAVHGNVDKNDRDVLYFESPHFGFSFYVLPNQLHLNMESELRTFERGLDVHGVLGQTYGWVLADEAGDAPLRHPQGEDGDYEVSGLFEDDFLYNRYAASAWKKGASVQGASRV